MLGPPKTRDLDRPVLISVESSVPQHYFYRHLHCALDLSFVRNLAADCYASGGRPSIDPEVFFRLHLIMFFSGIRSDRQLLVQASDNLAGVSRNGGVQESDAQAEGLDRAGRPLSSFGRRSSGTGCGSSGSGG
jgi:hypothetical protein